MFIVALLAPAAALVSRAAAGDDFVVSYWYGPPPAFTTIERYREIRDAGFTVVFPPGPPDTSVTVQQNLKILDFCRELGLKAVIADGRMPGSLSADDAKKRIDAIVADYGSHPALLAYFVTHEPSAGDFDGLGEVAAYLRQRDPRHPAFINLFPTYAAPWSQLGTATYDEYLRRFVAAVEPFVISFDHYPFLKLHDRDDYFANLASVRNASLTAKRPFWTIAQLTQHYDYRSLTEPELRYQAMQALAFGSRGLLWYTYWYPGQKTPTVSGAMIDHDGGRTPAFDRVKRVNAEVRALGDALLEARSWATFHTGRNVLFPIPPHCPIKPADAGELTIGVFETADRKMALVASRDYREPMKTAVSIDGNPPVERLQPGGGWRDCVADGQGAIALELAPGGAVLLRW